MNQFDIFTFNFPEAGPHPAVIVSHPDRVKNASAVNVLICSSARAARPPRAHEVLLNGSDGLDWETLCRCDLLYSVQKNGLSQRRGRVTRERQRAIVAKINSSMGWTAL